MLDTVLVPKVGSASDVEFVATLLDQIEQRNGWAPGRIGIHILIETAKGMANVEAIARARPDRLEAMVFGVADYAASVQARTTNIGGANPDYAVLTDADVDGVRVSHWGDQWHFGISRMVAACRAEGLRPIDGPVRGLQRCARGIGARRDAPPRSVAKASGRSTPPRSPWPTRSSRRRPPRSQRAERILQAMEDGAKEGKGAVSLDGRLIDAASIRMAQNLMTKVEQMRAGGGV